MTTQAKIAHGLFIGFMLVMAFTAPFILWLPVAVVYALWLLALTDS
jgi:hypothetical protein